MPKATPKTTSRIIAQLIPKIIQGAQLGFLAGRSITQTQFFVLVSLHSNGGCPMSKIASNMKVSVPTMTGIVNRLVKAQYVQRVTNVDDRRQVVVTLAPKAEALIKQFQTVLSARWEDVLGALTPMEVDSLFQVVTKLNERLQSK